MNTQPGEVVGNRYTLVHRIATGGMGQVWQATDTVLGRTVAIKVLSAGYSEDSGFAQRFRDEARHSAGLSHPNIAAVYDYGEEPGGAAYLVMEYVPGEPLSRLIARDAPIPPDRAVGILAQAADALQAAHDGGVIHRDIKPANIMLTPDGTVKLTDFGISRAIGGSSLTRTGEVMGTAQYLAPEQAIGKSPSAATDIYALGVVGYEMLSGRRPFDSESVLATALAQVHDAPPELPSAVPARLAALVMTTLAKEPADRPHTAAGLAADLRVPQLLESTGPVTTILPDRPSRPRTAPLPAVPVPAGPAPSGPRDPRTDDSAGSDRGAATQQVPTDAGEQQPVRAPAEPAAERPRRASRAWVWLALLALLLGGGGYAAAHLHVGGTPSNNVRVTQTVTQSGTTNTVTRTGPSSPSATTSSRSSTPTSSTPKPTSSTSHSSSSSSSSSSKPTTSTSHSSSSTSHSSSSTSHSSSSSSSSSSKPTTSTSRSSSSSSSSTKSSSPTVRPNLPTHSPPRSGSSRTARAGAAAGASAAGPAR